MKFSEREERIRAKAHELWEKEGKPEGQAAEHWRRAAQDIDREDERAGNAADEPAATSATPVSAAVQAAVPPKQRQRP